MSNSKIISKSQFENWPFTVDEGLLECNGDRVTFRTGEVLYGINGHGATYAKSHGGKDISEIQAIDEKLTQKLLNEGVPTENATAYMDIGEVVKLGLTLCQ